MKTNQPDIERLFRTYYEAMYHHAWCILGNDDESRDVVSEVFENLINHQWVILPSTERAYLLQAVRNRCANVIAQKDARERIARGITTNERIWEQMTDEVLTDRVAIMVERLEPPLRRQIVVSRFWTQLTYNEIAARFGISRVTVFNHLTAAIRQIRQEINGEKNS